MNGAADAAELADALAEVKRLRREADEKARELDLALERLTRLTDDVGSSSGDGAVAAPQPLRPVSEPADATPREALLRATQMAVSGSSRDEIESVLEREFELPDPDQVVERILGPTSDGATTPAAQD